MSVLKKPVIYQLLPRYFSNTNTTNQPNGTITQNGCGKFSEIDDKAIHELKDLGVTHVWLTGCLRQATLTPYPTLGFEADDPDIVKGIAGSFFSIKDYYDVCPDYAMDPETRMEEFELLIARFHAADIQVLMDFVPNHVSRAYASSVKPERNFGANDDQSQGFQRDNHFFYLPGEALKLQHPDYYAPAGVTFDGRFVPEDGQERHVPKVTGNATGNYITASPGFNDWYECIKLNYGYNVWDQSQSYEPPPATWAAMDEIIHYWQTKGIDGFRCDWAHAIPQEAWTYLISRARGRQDVFFLAEAYANHQDTEPINDNQQLIEAGFDAIYHYQAYNRLKQIYHGVASMDDYDNEMKFHAEDVRVHLLTYLENHDEVRVAGPINHEGFGSMQANYQLAPLQFLYGAGPVMLLNGQEVGEPGGHGDEGFHATPGRTTFFDYWSMPELIKWVNGHQYDGHDLSQEQLALRRYFRDLLALCQDASIRGSGYWSLRYFNRASVFNDCPDDLYSFARFEPESGRLALVVANFHGSSASTGHIRAPIDLVNTAKLPDTITVKLALTSTGRQNTQIAALSQSELIHTGFEVTIGSQETQVFIVE